MLFKEEIVLVRFGIIGTNWITEEFIKAASEVENFKLSAVYSRTEERALVFAEKFGVTTTFTNLESMAQSEEIDAVYIASPNLFHANQAILFMENKKHVLCEKPLATNAAEVKRMIDAAKENGVLLMEALKSTVLPNFKEIQKQLPAIGKVRRVFSNYCQYSSRYDAYKQGTILNAFKPELGNGAVMDIGVYCIYPIIVLFGKPNSVQANGIRLESGVDGEGSIILKYDDMDAVIMYSKITNSYVPSEIQGEEGNILIDKIHTPEKVSIYYRNGSNEEVSQMQNPRSMYYEAEEFIRLIESGDLESTTNSHAASLITMEIMEEVRKQIGVVFPSDSK